EPLALCDLGDDGLQLADDVRDLLARRMPPLLRCFHPGTNGRTARNLEPLCPVNVVTQARLAGCAAAGAAPLERGERSARERRARHGYHRSRAAPDLPERERTTRGPRTGHGA